MKKLQEYKSKLAKMASQHGAGNGGSSQYQQNGQQPAYPQGQFQNYQSQYQQPPYEQHQQPSFQNPQTQGNATMPQGQDRSEQMEYFQSYEASARDTEDDKNQATLQKEFPDIDSSLIAAIYGDSKSLSATREMLMELSRKD